MKQCPQCRRSYDDSQNFCLMDGTPLVIEPEQETVVRQQPVAAAAPKKSRRLLWLGLAAFVGVSAAAVIAGLLIYNFAGRDAAGTQTQNNRNASRSPVPTATSTPKATPTPKPANTSANTESSSETEISPAGNSNSADNPNSDEEITPIDWSTTATGFKNDIGMTYKFQCPADGKEYAVWGSDIYTADSSICTAAVHAGLFSLADGGAVTVEFRPGRLTYGSTTRNGIKSMNFGEYRLSFVVR